MISYTTNDLSFFLFPFFFFSQVHLTHRQVFQTYVVPRVQRPSIGGHHLTMAVARLPVTPWRWIVPVKIAGQRSLNPASPSASRFLPSDRAPWYLVRDIVSVWEPKISTGLANPVTNLNLFEFRKKVKCVSRRMKKVIVRSIFQDINYFIRKLFLNNFSLILMINLWIFSSHNSKKKYSSYFSKLIKFLSLRILSELSIYENEKKK